MRRFQLESPFNYQHELQLFDVLKDTVLNGILQWNPTIINIFKRLSFDENLIGSSSPVN